MSAHADCFTVAILKGAVEGDTTKHFAALGGFCGHWDAARELGLVDDRGPTPHAIDLYERYRLGELPEGRAYLWPRWLLADVLAYLNGGGT